MLKSTFGDGDCLCNSRISPEVAVQSRSFVQYSKSRSKNKKHKWSDLTSTTGRPAQTVLQDFIEAMDTGFQRLGSYLGLMIASRAFQFISFYVILCHSIAFMVRNPLQLRDRVENTTVEPTTGTTTPEADPSCSRWCLHVKWQMSSWLVNSLSVYASLCMIYRILDHLDHLGGSSNQGIPIPDFMATWTAKLMINQETSRNHVGVCSSTIWDNPV